MKSSVLLCSRLLPILIACQCCTVAVAQISIKKQANWHGNISINGQYSSYKPAFQEIPGSYLYLSSSQTLSVAQIPIRADLFLSSYNPKTLNQLTFSIDHAQMEQAIRKRIEEKTNELKANVSVNAMDRRINQNYADADAYKDIYRINDKLERGKDVDPETLDQYGEVLDSQEQLQKYDPGSYEKYQAYVKLKTLDGKDDLQNDMKWLEENKIINSYERFWYSFETIQIGTTHPYLSKYVLAGIPVNGYYFALYKKGLYLAAVNGLAIPYENRLSNPGYTRQVKSYKAGLGNTKSSHFHLIYMNATDNNTADSIAPKANSVAGVETRLQVFNKRLSIDIGAYGGLLTNNTTNTDQDFSPGLSEIMFNPTVANWAADEVRNNSSTSYDYAYNVNLRYTGKGGTRAGFGIENVQPGYHSLGVAYLQKDIHRYRMEFSQSLLNRNINVSAKIRYDKDNLNGAKQNRSTNTNGMLKISAAFKGLPKIGVYYMPNIYKSVNTESGATFIHQSHNINLLLSHAYNLGGMPSFSNFTVTYNNYQVREDLMNSVSSLLHQQISMNKKVTTGIRAIYRSSTDFFYWSVEPDILIKLSRVNSIGISLRYGSDHLGNEKIGINASMSLRIMKRIFWRMSILENYYSTTSGINDLMVRTSIVTRW